LPRPSNDFEFRLTADIVNDGTVMNPHLEHLDREIASAIEKVAPHQLVQSWNGKWTIVQILEHLLLTYTATGKGFQRALTMGQTRASSPSIYQRLASFLVITVGYFPEGRKSPPQALPSGMSADDVVNQIRTQLAEMDRLATECEKKFGKVRVLDHPIFGGLNIMQWRKFHATHGRHHCRQILDRLKTQK